MKDIENVINYLETAIKLKSEYSDFLTKIGIEDPVIMITDYIICNGLITSSRDILELSNNFTIDIVNIIADKYDDYHKKIQTKKHDDDYTGYLFPDLLV